MTSLTRPARRRYATRLSATAERPPRRLLGVYAHPDDETVCAGGTLAKYAATGADILIVSATRGEAGQIRDVQAATRRTLGSTRVQELQCACVHLGVQHMLCFDHGDGKLQALDQRLLVAQITEIIRTFRPDVVLTFGDDGAYGHPDHIAVGIATDAACMFAGDSTQFPEQLVGGVTPHAPAQLYHSCFPRHSSLLLEHLVHWLMGLDARFHGTPDFVHSLLIFANEAVTLGYSRDHISVSWYPPGFAIIEQGEAPQSLYFILSGTADVVRETADGCLHKVAEIGAGSFFGEEGLASHRPRNAYVIARDSVSCLVFSPTPPPAFVGRGPGVLDATEVEDVPPASPCVTTRIDVSAYVPNKLAAIAAHRTQFPIAFDRLPETLLQQFFAYEYFVRICPPGGMLRPEGVSGRMYLATRCLLLDSAFRMP